jgi:hypothetical protein
MESKLEVVSTKNEKHEYRVNLAEKLEAKLTALRNDVSEKKYPVSGGITTAIALEKFVKTQAKWKFSEALGIMEASRVLKEEISALRDKKKEELELNAITVEAIYYFLTKEEGSGLESAKYFVMNLLRPISEALNASKSDRDTINQMERDLGSLQDAILNKVGIEKEDAFLESLEKELEKELAE